MQNHVLTHPTLTHPHTGQPLRAVGYGKRGPIWPILGASDDDGGGGDGDGAGTDSGGSSSDWKPPASQADLDRIIQQRLDRERAKFADYDTIREKAEQFDAFAESVKTDQERAVEAAREEARETAWQAAMAHAVPRVVSAEFKAEAARQGIEADKLNAILEDLDLVKYATDDGDPDTEKIGKKLSAFAPAKPTKQTGPSSSGLGNRGGDVSATPKDIASSYLAKKFPGRAKAS